MRIGTLNLGHTARPPKSVPEPLLDALVALDADLLLITEFVSTNEYTAALEARWPHVAASKRCLPDRRGFVHNQVAALSRHPLRELAGNAPDPTECAETNFLSVETEGLVVTGVRAPSYERMPDWYAYWAALNARLDGDVVIGDLNVDPSRKRKKDRVLPEDWQVVTPGGPSYRSLRNGDESTLDHALVRPGIDVGAAEYRPEFFGRWKLDHCPLLVEVQGA